jgi:hypothetical protein
MIPWGRYKILAEVFETSYNGVHIKSISIIKLIFFKIQSISQTNAWK